MLEGNLQDALRTLKVLTDVLAKIEEDHAAGLSDTPVYEASKAAALAAIRPIRDAVEAAEAAVEAEKDRLAAEKQAQDAADAAAAAADAADDVDPTDQETAAAAQTLYEQADRIYDDLIAGTLSESQWAIQIESIQTQLLALDWPMWIPPKPEAPEPVEPAAPAAAVDLTPIEKLLGKYGFTEKLEYDPTIANQLKDLVNSSLITSGFNPELVDQVRDSPASPEKAAETATALAQALLGATILGGSASIAAEAASMGQIEAVTSIFMFLMGITGADDLGRTLALLPYKSAIFTPAEQYYNSINRPEIPGTGDLIRFLVREAITQDRFGELMARQGYSDELAENFWVAHWREIGENRINEAFHRGVIDRDERDKYLIILDYRPDARPGFGIADRDIIGSLSKRLIPRVDVRRAWEYGLIDDDDLLQRYVALGYEEDAPMMAQIQREAALAGEKSAVARAAGRAYRDGVIPEDRFLEVLAGLGYPNQVQALWVLRYQWESIAGSGFTPEELAEQRIAEAVKAAEVKGEEEPEGTPA